MDDSASVNRGESLLFVGVVTTANGGGISLDLNFAPGPRRSRILAEVLGDAVDESGNDGAEETFGTGGLRRFVDVERTGNDDDGGQFKGEIKLLFGGVLGVGVVGGGFRVSDGEMSDAGTGGGGGGGCSVAANDL